MKRKNEDIARESSSCSDNSLSVINVQLMTRARTDQRLNKTVMRMEKKYRKEHSLEINPYFSKEITVITC